MFVFLRHVPTSLNVLITAASYDELLLIIVTSDFIYQLQPGKRLQHTCCLLEMPLGLDNLMVLFSPLFGGNMGFQMPLVLRSQSTDQKFDL